MLRNAAPAAITSFYLTEKENNENNPRKHVLVSQTDYISYFVRLPWHDRPEALSLALPYSWL